MASPAPPIIDHKAPELPVVEHRTPSPPPTLSDHLLEEIFIRLPTPAALARSSIACPSFRRIITDRSFLRRYHALHPPPLLGFVSCDRCFHPAQPPHPSAAMAGALAQAADFSYSFIPTGRWNTPWSPKDVRQGRVLLECVPEFTLADALNDTFCLRDLELAVCDPLYRRYVLLPPIPDHLTDLYEGLFDFGKFLAPTVEDEEETSFRVVCTAWNGTELLAFVFASITGQWSIAASPSWASLGTGPPHFYHSFAYFDFARGCFYWTGAWIDKVIVLDALKMEFSIVNNKPSVNLRRYSGEPHVVVGEEGTPLMLFISDINDDVSGGPVTCR